MDTYELAVRYMFYHTFALIVCGMLMEKFPALKITVLLLLAGIILFSGSLLTLALTDEAGWGAVTPLGGIALLVGWGKAAWVIYKQPR